MGLGEALMEEQAFRRLPARLSNALVHKFPSMLENKSPTSLDMPEIFTDLIEHPDPQAPSGAKEVGQGPLLPIMPAVANAVFDAVGVRMDEIPVTPEKILRALRARRPASRRDRGPRRFPTSPGRSPCWWRRRGKAAMAARRMNPHVVCGATSMRASKRPFGSVMMRLPGFQYRAPRTIEEAAAWLADDPANAMLIAGGTDLLPNMKRRHQTPATLIGLRAIPELAQIRNGDGLTVGAGITLSALIAEPRIRQSYAGLWQAAAQVATPLLRNMGTVGGNLCLDTRCTYYNQNYEWRKSIDFCMKKDGQTCWVATSAAESAWRCRQPIPRRCCRH